MIKYVKGDLLESDAQIILHQVNLQGVMGGGLALQIANKYPNVEMIYKEYKDKKLGNVVFATADDKFIGNCFSQNEDFTTNYKALEQCLDKVLDYMNMFDLISVAIPYKYGCGIASGDWNKVEKIFENKFKDRYLTIYQL